MSVPDWWTAALLIAAAWRTFQLLSADDILDVPRRYVEAHLNETWRDFLSCPYCFGAWLSLVVYLLWIWFPTETLVVCTPLSLNVGVIALAKIFADRD